MKNNYKIFNDKVIILINSKYGNFETIIDLDDFKEINNYKNSWCINYKKGRIDGVRMKIQINKRRKQIWLHRIITKCPINKEVDHINGNTLDNRKANLRIVTQKQNSSNLSSSSKNKTKYRNIYFENGKYRVRINNIRFGGFDNLDNAIKCRNLHLKEIYPLRNRID